MAFADYYPLATFETIADASWWRAFDFDTTKPLDDQAAYEAATAADTADRHRVDEHRKILEAAIEAFLVEQRHNGRLGTISGLRGRKVRIANAWNAFVNGETIDTFSWLLESLTFVWTDRFVRMDNGRYARTQSEDHVRGSHQLPTKEQIVNAWTAICRSYDEGNSYDMFKGRVVPQWRIEANEVISGDNCQLHFADWKASLLRYDKTHTLVPVEDLVEEGMATASFEMPTGVMLLTDDLRISAFDKGTEFDPDRDYGDLDLNSVRGRNARVLAHADDHQMAFTQTSNTCVRIFRDVEGRLLVTERWNGDNEDGVTIPGWTCVGDVSCDVWSITAIDKTNAIAHMAAGGSINAEAELDQYLGSDAVYSDNIVTLEVQPGTWRIHGGDNFDKLADRKAMNLPKGIHLWCLMERA